MIWDHWDYSTLRNLRGEAWITLHIMMRWPRTITAPHHTPYAMGEVSEQPIIRAHLSRGSRHRPPYPLTRQDTP